MLDGAPAARQHRSSGERQRLRTPVLVDEACWKYSAVFSRCCTLPTACSSDFVSSMQASPRSPWVLILTVPSAPITTSISAFSAIPSPPPLGHEPDAAVLLL